MNYYPEQLRRIAAMCEALDKGETEGEGATFKQRIVVVYPESHPESPDEILGYLIDEIGGAWSFEPAH